MPLVMMDRERAGREASPSAAIIDSQSVKTTEAGARVATMQGRRSKGASAMHWSIPKGGRYWSSHIRPTSRTGTAADHCYRSRAPLLPFIKHVWSDGGYNHERVTTATNIIVEIVSKPPDQVGFAVLPQEMGGRALLRMDQPQPAPGKGFRGHHQFSSHLPLRAASVMLLVRRLARQS